MDTTRPGGSRPRRLLFATDSSPASRAARLAVAGLAVGGATHVIVLHVDDRSQSESGQQLVENVACALIALAVDARPELRQASPGEIGGAIAAAAIEYGVDLVVLGSRGQADIGGLLLGSIADDVLERVSCPLLLVRAGRRAGARNRRVLVAVAGDEDPRGLIRAAAAVAVPDARVLVLQLPAPRDLSLRLRMPEGIVDQVVAGLRLAGVRARGRLRTSSEGSIRDIARITTAYGADLVVVGSGLLPVLTAQLYARAGSAPRSS